MVAKGAGQGTPLSVLIIEDHPEDAELVVHELRRAGYAPNWKRVMTADEYRAALNDPPDIILSDYNLPSFNGSQALDIRNELGLDIPFILVTGAVGEEVAVECMRRGAADYLLKDRLTRLGPAVEHALSGHREYLEKRAAERQVGEQYQVLHGIIESSNAEIYSVDRNLRYTIFNRNHEDRMRSLYAADIRIGVALPECIAEPADREAAIICLQRGVTGEQFTVYSASGKEQASRYAEETYNPIRGNAGEVVGVAVFSVDVSDRYQAEKRIKDALAEKIILLREIHHRVKNNLQAVIHLIGIKREQVADIPTQAFLLELQEQARTMSLVYEQLFQAEDLARVQMGSYLRTLMDNLLDAFGRNRAIGCEVRAEEITMDVETAMPCGLVINELVTNALKYAFPAGQAGGGMITVELSEDETGYRLRVGDNGEGLPAGIDWNWSGARGLKLVSLWICHQLGGSIDVDRTGGTTFRMTFPKRKPARKT